MSDGVGKIPCWIVDATSLFDSDFEDLTDPIEVVRKSDYEQLEKEKAELLESLNTAHQYIGSLRGHGYAIHVKIFEELWAKVVNKFKLEGGK